MVAEHYKRNLAQPALAQKFADVESLTRLAFEILQGLDYIHKQRIVHRNLQPKHILLDPQVSVKWQIIDVFLLLLYMALIWRADNKTFTACWRVFVLL